MLRGCRKKGTLLILLVGNKRYKYYGEHGASLTKVRTIIPYNPVIPLLSIYPDKTIIKKVIHMPSMFTAALFAIAKTWKQSKCVLTDNWIKKDVLYIPIYATQTHTHRNTI